MPIREARARGVLPRGMPVRRCATVEPGEAALRRLCGGFAAASGREGCRPNDNVSGDFIRGHIRASVRLCRTNRSINGSRWAAESQVKPPPVPWSPQASKRQIRHRSYNATCHGILPKEVCAGESATSRGFHDRAWQRFARSSQPPLCTCLVVQR